MPIALIIHALGSTVWVGGMFFALICLRPIAAGLLEAPQRAQLWAGVLNRFIAYVGLSIVAILASGIYLVAWLGGLHAVGPGIHGMIGVGVLMMLIAAHLYFAPLRRLCRAVEAGDWPAAGRALQQIRIIVTVNLALGVIAIALGAASSLAGISFD